MLQITCPWCGPRDDNEFHYGGEAHIARPLEASKLSDAEWAEYLFLKQNPKGPFTERWSHSAGCRQWFNVVRNTATDEIIEIYPLGELPKSPEGIEAYETNWRRQSAAQKNAKAGASET